MENEKERIESMYLYEGLKSREKYFIEVFKIITRFIKRKANVTYWTAQGCSSILFTLLTMYEDAVKEYLDGNDMVFIGDNFIIKSKKDFEMEDVSSDTLRKCFEILDNLGFIIYKPRACNALLKPVVPTIIDAFEEQREIVYKEREERVK